MSEVKTIEVDYNDIGFRKLPKNTIGTTHLGLGGAVQNAKKIAVREGAVVSFNSEGVRISVDQGSDLRLILRDWRMSRYGGSRRDVGPNCDTVLNEEQTAELARVDALQRRRTEDRMSLLSEGFGMRAMGALTR